MDASKKTFLTMGEVSKQLDISPETIRRLVGRGELRAYKAGAWHRFTQEDIDAFKKRCTLN